MPGKVPLTPDWPRPLSSTPVHTVHPRAPAAMLVPKVPGTLKSCNLLYGLVLHFSLAFRGDEAIYYHDNCCAERMKSAEVAMPRPPRFSYAHAVHHVTLRCNNREFLFTEPTFALFPPLLAEARARFPLALYNYCLMTNHVHLLFRVGRDDTLSKAMHWLSTSFTRRFNRITERHGHVWEKRFRSTIIEQRTYFLRCMAYVDLNPVRAGMASTPTSYCWSGHAALRAEHATQLDFHPLYLELGADAPSRYRRYEALLAEEASREPVGLAGSYFVGSRRFVGRMERRFGFGTGSGRLSRRPLAGGVILSGPSHGGSRRPK